MYSGGGCDTIQSEDGSDMTQLGVDVTQYNQQMVAQQWLATTSLAQHQWSVQ